MIDRFGVVDSCSGISLAQIIDLGHEFVVGAHQLDHALFVLKIFLLRLKNQEEVAIDTQRNQTQLQLLFLTIDDDCTARLKLTLS